MPAGTTLSIVATTGLACHGVVPPGGTKTGAGGAVFLFYVSHAVKMKKFNDCYL